MKILNLVQGSPEWHEHRRTHFNASDAPAMLGMSEYKTRTQLLHEISTGIVGEFDDATQRRFADGHRFEALARPVAESMIDDSLSPVVGVEGRLSASFDGITFDGSIIFEHKTINCSLKDITDSSQLHEQYRAQMEQQLMVSGASRCLFMASKWDDDDQLVNEMHVWYKPDQAMRDRILQGWTQFAIDLENYVPVQISEKPIADAIAGLPALFVQARGEITAHNMEAFGKSLAISLANSRSIVLTTDQDYSNAEAAAKLYRETCKKLVLVKEAVLAQATTIGEATRMIDTWHEDLRVTALRLEKDVAEKKEAQKLAIITEALMAYIGHVNALEAEIKPIRLNLPAPEFAGSLKGKRLISAWHDAVNTLLANSKILADAQAKDIREKLSWQKVSSTGFEFLFTDLAYFIQKPLDDFKLLVTSRIESHKVAEAAKLEVERDKIRIEEEAKAKAKIEAEALAKAQADAAAQKVIDDKERDKSDADEKATRIQDDLQAARDGGLKRKAEIAEQVLVANQAITDEQVITSLADEFDITFDESCDLILRVAKNMKVAA